jgi:hypothetical protein
MPSIEKKMHDQVSRWAWENVRIFEEFNADQTDFFGVISRTLSRKIPKLGSQSWDSEPLQSRSMWLVLLSRIKEL